MAGPARLGRTIRHQRVNEPHGVESMDAGQYQSKRDAGQYQSKRAMNRPTKRSEITRSTTDLLADDDQASRPRSPAIAPEDFLILMLCLSTHGLMQMPTPMPRINPNTLRRATWVPASREK